MTDASRHTLRTVVQTLLALAAGLPLIIDAAGIPQTAAASAWPSPWRVALPG